MQPEIKGGTPPTWATIANGIEQELIDCYATLEGHTLDKDVSELVRAARWIPILEYTLRMAEKKGGLAPGEADAIIQRHAHKSRAYCLAQSPGFPWRGPP